MRKSAYAAGICIGKCNIIFMLLNSAGPKAILFFSFLRIGKESGIQEIEGLSKKEQNKAYVLPFFFPGSLACENKLLALFLLEGFVI